jgi:alpha-beta hydrolase superfamily lysophospholipase
MGGAISLSFLENSTLADEVVAVVLDAPALKLGAMVDAEAADTNLPLLPISVPMPLTAVAKAVAAFRFDVDWDAIDYLDRASELTVPILVFHGVEDETVPVELSRRFAEARPDLVELVEVAGADHVRSWNVDPEVYLAAVGQLLDEVVTGTDSG